MSNLKIDIIYYKTSSDFELEFNLSGCCRMRIFKDKVDTQKGLINTLARDVARSKIIIVVTDLFGEESGVPALSKAISLPLITPNKAEYGIKTEDTVYMPDTAVPLVTKSGIYGGCIIESGPQSIIIVSSVRSLRHEIMKTYVHNYVFDVGQLMAYKERMGEGSHNVIPPSISNLSSNGNGSANGNDENIILPTSEPTATSDEIIDDITPNLPAETEPVVEEPTYAVFENLDSEEVETPSSEEATVTEETSSEDSSETESDLEAAIAREMQNKERSKPRNIVHPGISAVDELEFDKEEEKEVLKKSKKKRKGMNILLLIIVILLLIGFGILAYFLVYLPLTGAESSFGEEGNILSELFGSLFG